MRDWKKIEQLCQKYLSGVVLQNKFSFFFCLAFLSGSFTNHRTAGEGAGNRVTFGQRAQDAKLSIKVFLNIS